MSVGRRIGGSLVAAVLTLFALQAAPSLAFDSPSSGEITRAQVGPNWTVASIAGSANTTVQAGCELPEPPEPPEEEHERSPWLGEEPWLGPCGWIPYATVGPGTSQADCSSPGRRRYSLGEDVQLVWAGDEMENPGSITFDLSGIALAHGSGAPLLCLSAIQEELVGNECPQDGSYCPPNYSVVHYYQQLDLALLEPVAPPEEPVVGPIQLAAPQSFVVPAGKGASHCRTVNPRRKAKGDPPEGKCQPTRIGGDRETQALEGLPQSPRQGRLRRAPTATGRSGRAR